MNKTSAIKKLNDTELELGIAGTAASWHQRYLECDCVYVGGLPDTLTEQDLLGILEQYGIVLHLNLVRDSQTNSSRGFAFARYADPRSCSLAIDNLNGFELQGRTMRLDHADDYQDKDEAGQDTSPPGFYQHREESTKQKRTSEDHQTSEDRQTSLVELNVEKRREKAVLERLAQLRNRRRTDLDEKSRKETPDEIQPSHETAELSTEQDRSADKHEAEKRRRRIEKERRRQEKEQRKTERARIRQERADRRATRENGT